ncbi:hypothetical protein FGG08_005462 [Glutinoglossum americanum]|uniref:Uncharacterized protein n=1 Tax=Glutinoglossum americanum TaxID=1670608 RepID=A0A9P8HY68_9PEZI|nr:hypothetical protein FGG08_005462 [Glutinoglossum americanum]
MGSARTEATKRRKERSRARKAAKALKDLRNGEPAHPRSYATRASTRSWIEAKNSDFEPSGSGDRNSYPASVVRLHRKHWIKDREHSFDLPIRSRTLPTVTPQLERSSLVTLKGYEQRGQPDDLNHGLFGFSSGQSSHSQVTSESFSPLDEMPKSMFQPAKSRSAQHSRGPAWVGENNQMIDPLQTTSGAIDTLLTHGEEGGGVSLADHRSYDPCGPSSGCHKSPGVLGPKIQQREGGERLSAKSLPDMQGGGIRADMVRDSERLFQESSYGIAGR